MHFRLADYAVWLLSPTLQAGVLLAMYRRGLLRRYPAFLAYTILDVASACILAALAYRPPYTAYFYAYYAQLVLSIVISFAVSWEIIKFALRRSKPTGLRWFGIIGTFVLLIGALGVFLRPEPLTRDAILGLMALGDHSLRWLQVVLFVALIFFGKAVRLSWKSITFGLAVGFGVFAIVNLAIASELSHHGPLTSATVSTMNSVAYLVAVTIWLLYVIFGLEDEGGKSRASCLVMRDQEDHSRPKPPTRWFFRQGVFDSGFSSRG
jgi:hypothetical protein